MKSIGPIGTVCCGVLLAILAGCNGDDASNPSQSSVEQTAGATSDAPQSMMGTATLDWLPPTANTNGSVLTNLAGYHIHYGTNERSLDKVIDISNIGVTSYVVEGLTTGKWYFAVTAYSSEGTESALSNLAMITIT